MINLISNAVKFTHAGSVSLLCELEKQQKQVYWVKITVRDTGVGIPPEKLNTIFESFSQADESVTRRYGGTGLGLTIARQLVDLQKGKIDVDSKEHVGSTFTVRIPYPVDKNNRAQRSNLDTKSRNINNIDGNLRVLLVEDNDINRLYAKSILKNWKCRTDIAENGLIAVEKLKNNVYDVILMDVQMPVMDGYDATKAIRTMSPPSSTVPIIALTANVTKNDVDKCLAAGMNDYLPKPFSPEDLYQKLFEDLKLVPVKPTKPKPIRTQKVAFDLTYLRSVSGNNESFVKEMVETFIQSIPQSLTELREAMALSDSERLARITHQIKPSLTLLGLDSLRDIAVTLEGNFKTIKLPNEQLGNHLKLFIEKCTAAIKSLESELTFL